MISRKKASVRNASIALLAQLVKMFGQFIVQTIFVKTLGAEYLGANGLFTNLITFLSFTELGIGTAFSYELYRPLATGNFKLTSSIINLFRKVYNFIGLSILFLGLAITYFVPSLASDATPISNIRLYFVLFLLSSVVSYFFTYNRSLLIADQRGYVDSANQLYFSLFKYVFQIVFLIFFKSYIGFLVVQILSNFLSNLAITKLANKNYPYLIKNKSVSPPQKIVGEIRKNVVGTVSSKIGSIVVNGTDNILISKFVGLYWVGLYSNYSLITAGIVTVLNQVLNSVIASFGNLGVTEEQNLKKQLRLFDNFVYFNAFSVFFIGLFLFGIFQPFVNVWLGSKYELSNLIMFLVVINFIFGQFRPALFLVNAYGLFWGYRYKSIVEAAVNFGLSLVLVQFTNLGISGVLIGTIIGNILVNSWWDPLILFSGAYHQGILKFYLKYWLYLLAFFVLLFVENIIVQIVAVKIDGIISLIIYAATLGVGIGGTLLLALAGTSSERQFVKQTLDFILKK